MKKLKFAQDEGSLFYKELTEQLDAYFERKKIGRSGNSLMYFKIFIYFGAVVLLYILMMRSTTVYAFYGFYLGMGIAVLLTAFNISHDAAHGVAVKSKTWNKILFSLSFNLQGNNAYIWGKHHNDSHHLYTNVEGSDIDVLHNPLFRMTDTQALKWHHKYQWLYAPFLYLLYSLNWSLFRETLLIFRLSSRTISIEIPKVEIIKLLFFKILYLTYMIVIPALVQPWGLLCVLLAFVLNHFIISLIFVGVLGVSHVTDYVAHPLPDQDNKLNMSWPMLQMKTSIDYNPDSRWLNWTLGGFNAHTLHHLLPQVSHVHYLDILPIFRNLCQKHGLTYMEMPYSSALASHFRYLKAMGTLNTFKPSIYER